MATIGEALAHAGRCFQAGNLAQAEQTYLHILQAAPDHAEALHMLGVLSLKRGQHLSALDYLHRVRALIPQDPGVACNLALVHLALRQWDQAGACCREALCLRPDLPEAHNLLGNALAGKGRLEAAVACYREALGHRPQFPDALGNLGNALGELGRLDEAVACYREALRLRPNSAETLNNLGNVFKNQGKLQEAESCCREALRLRPGFAEASSNLATVLHEQDRWGEAEACFCEALRFRPGLADAHANLGNLFGEQGRLEEAEGCFHQAIRCQPDHAEAHFHLGLLWLLKGDFQRGWPEAEWRWRTRAYATRSLAGPRWDGTTLEGRTILLQAEQGLGDSIQFIRYAALLKKRGGRVLVQCNGTLRELFARCPGVEQVIAQGEAVPAFDVCASLLSLPGLLGTTLDRVPAEIPYLAGDPQRVARWKEVLEKLGGKLRVGIVWQGNPAHRNDRRRSVPLTQFEPLFRVPGVQIVSMQVGAGAKQLSEVAKRWPIADLASLFDPSSFADAAAVLCELDLLVSVDTAIVHLAGALGRPVWVALPFAADWRWLREREDTPWYPTMRLFRQRQSGQWAEVFERMATALDKRSLAHKQADSQGNESMDVT
jgi:tetratricopeptide (TPR) repeat protein